MSDPVLVIGAGPTGLSMGIHLRRHGVAVRVVDKAAGPASESRALAIHSRTLEILEDMGCLQPVLDQGIAWHAINVVADGRRLVHVGFDEIQGPYPFLQCLPQSSTERVLLDRFTALGGVVERGVELRGFTQDSSGVQVTLARGGAEERVTAPYLIGCDGAHSAVRKGLGVAFEGSPYEEKLVLADVEADTELTPDETYVYLSPEGMLAVFPMPTGFRVIAQLPEEREPTPELFQALLRTRAKGVRFEVKKLGWKAAFRIHHRVASKLQVGRVFLAGDAAHIHSPLGGQGMNTGIQDTYNLGWKLALVLGGLANPRLLESYEAERLPVARAVVFGTDLATRVVMVRHPIAQEIRNLLATVLSPLEVIQRRMLNQASELGVHYRKSPIVEGGAGPGVHAGDRAPDFELAPGSRFLRKHVGTRHTLLVAPGSDATVAAKWDAQLERVALTEARFGKGYVLVRPDGYVGFRGQRADALEQHLERLFTR